jgi:hypothetical protein
MPHPIPSDLAGWLAAFRPSRSGNPFLKLGDDLYVIFPARGIPPGFQARAGRSILEGRWPTVEAAQRALFDLVTSLTPAELAELHGPADDRRQPDRPAADRTEPRNGTPPEDDGDPLGVFGRADGREEMRVVLKTFEGRQYIALRVWFCDDQGQWWPTKKGLSVRLREAVGVITALQKGLSLASRPAATAPTGGGRLADGPADRPAAAGRGGGGWSDGRPG